MLKQLRAIGVSPFILCGLRGGNLKIMKLIITQRRSAIRRAQNQKDTIQALGLSRLHQKVEHADTPQIRGMVEKVKHLVEVREQD